MIYRLAVLMLAAIGAEVVLVLVAVDYALDPLRAVAHLLEAVAA